MDNVVSLGLFTSFGFKIVSRKRKSFLFFWIFQEKSKFHQRPLQVSTEDNFGEHFLKFQLTEKARRSLIRDTDDLDYRIQRSQLTTWLSKHNNMTKPERSAKRTRNEQNEINLRKNFSESKLSDGLVGGFPDFFSEISKFGFFQTCSNKQKRS